MSAACTCPQCVRPPTEVRQLVVDDDTRPWRVDGAAEAEIRHDDSIRPSVEPKE